MSHDSKEVKYRTILDRDEDDAQRLIAVNQAIANAICKDESPTVTAGQRANNMELVLRGIDAQRLDLVNTVCKDLYQWGCRQVTHKIFLFRLDHKMWEKCRSNRIHLCNHASHFLIANSRCSWPSVPMVRQNARPFGRRHNLA